jgi:hypothetical protein
MQYVRGIVADIMPSGAIEWLWAKDIVDHSWEVARLRRIKTLLLKRREEMLRLQIEQKNRSHGIDPPVGPPLGDVMKAEFFIEELSNYERLDLLIASAETRRVSLLREIERRRAGLAARLRAVSDEIIDAEAEPSQPCLTEGGASEDTPEQDQAAA